MKRTTIFLDETLLRQAQRYARREGKTFAQLVREAVAVYVASGSKGPTGVPSVAGKFESGTKDTSERVDELLWKEPHG